MKSSSSPLVSTGLQLIAVFSLALLVGCADVITYSKDSRREGLRLMRAQEYADAAGAFRNATRQNPNDYQSYSYLGDSYSRLRQWQQAFAAYRTSLDVQSTLIEGRSDREFRERTLEGYAQAVAASDLRESEINTIQRRAHDRAGAEEWYLLAKIHAARGDADSAIECYTRAELIDSNNFYIAKSRGLYLERLGQTAKAEPSLRRAFLINDRDEEVAAALRRLGIVPGLSLKEENQLAQPLIPKGPIPEPELFQRTDPEPGLAGTGDPAPRD